MDKSTEFAVAVDSSSREQVVVRVHGDVDMATAARLEEALGSVPDTGSLVIDLSGCTFLDSAGVRVLTSAIRDERRLSIVTPDGGIRRVLEITAVDTVAGVYPSLDVVD